MFDEGTPYEVMDGLMAAEPANNEFNTKLAYICWIRSMPAFGEHPGKVLLEHERLACGRLR